MNQILKSTLILMLLAFASQSSFGQVPVRYDDVAIIANLNDTISLKVANYFMAKRGIPSKNLITFKNTNKEIIDSNTFEVIRKSIEDSIKSKGIQNSINYLVTTMGCPLKITRSDTCDNYDILKLPFTRCASFDNELMLILGKFKSEIGQAGIYNPKKQSVNAHDYFLMSNHFTKKQYDFYLVTRLAGLNYSQITKLIDRSGPNTVVDKSTDIFEIDDYPIIDSNTTKRMKATNKLLTSRGWTVKLDTTTTFLQNQKNVLGYISWGFTDYVGKVKPIKGFPNNQWANGAIGVSLYSFNGYTLNGASYTARATLPYVVKEGVSGWFATVYEPWSFSFPQPQILFDRYTDFNQDRHFNLAECYYMAAPTKSWMPVIVGDPKTSIYVNAPKLTTPIVDTITRALVGTKRTVGVKNFASGYNYWFKGDSNTIKSKGLIFDELHPSFVQSSTTLLCDTSVAKVGKNTFCFVSQNLNGTIIKQIDFTLYNATDIELISGSKLNQITLYPNPAKDNLIVNGLIQNQKILATIFDLTGKKMMQSSLNSDQNSINITTLPIGTYLLKIRSNKEERTIQFIKE